jgi:uncharacterized protein
MQKIKSAIHLLLGLFLILLGIAGLILPILNGMIFLLLGLILISFESKYVEYHLSKLAHRSAFSGRWYEKLLAFMNRLFRR